MTAYVVTESRWDADLLRIVIDPPLREHVTVGPAGSGSSVLSLARSLLGRRRVPVAIVIDADTVDEGRVEEALNDFNGLITQASGDTPFKVFLVAPKVPAIVFASPAAIDQLLEQAGTSRRWQEQEILALDDIISRLADGLRANHTWKLFTREAIEEMRSHPVVHQLNEFLRSAVAHHNSDIDH